MCFEKAVKAKPNAHDTGHLFYMRIIRMRDIKFRAWHINDKEMLGHKDACLIPLFTPSFRYRDDETALMQYTGLKDVNGVEIYEGDIVRIAMDIGATIRAEVMYECGSFWLFSHEIHYVFDEDQDNMIQLGSVCLEGDCYEDGCLKVIDVVGNIHQNPELLGGNK